MAGSLSLQFFGSELRRARMASGMTQEQLGEAVRYSTSMVAMIEQGVRSPSRELVAAADEVFKVDGLFGRIREKLIIRDASPEWFRPWREYEAEATALRAFAPLTVPGLLQTEEFARALLETGGQDVEERITARLDRKKIFERDKPPVFVAVLDEQVLRRPVGGAEVMHRQLLYLAERARQVIIQVVPISAGAYQGLDGAFVIGTVDSRDVAYLDTPARGYVVEKPETVADLRYRWDIVKADAVSRQQSRDLILEVADEWKHS